ncbi:PAS domain-containing sensor histidine kinase [Desulfopila sp. IMCC35008]|uniref:PAS domain-containing hybrid sensor histidine kinase/response regulator n=1 Tax=Desulfopila sp. IMCC35008 TaxID=2653858 RepID=UPI0013D677B6|nr:PAS domain-containing sensor histidine kinase [Desulfopila sp. IMCC35008]
MTSSNHLEIFKIVFLYAIFGCIWIYFSDSIVHWFVQDPDVITWIAIFKGILFICCTSLLLYVLIIRFNRKIHQSTVALHKSENQLNTLVQTIPDLVWLKDEHGVYLSCNLKFERFFGAKQTEIIGKTDYDFVDTELADFFREHDHKAMEAGGPSTNEEWITYADDGRHALLETIKTPMYDSDGKLIGVLGIGRDITDRKRMEDQQRESEDKFRLTFSSSPDAININRLKDGLYVDINDGFTRIMGYTSEDVIGKTSLELNIWDDITDRDRLVEILRTDGYCENLEAVFRRKDGKSITGLMSARIIPINSEPHIISISRDVSQRKQYEKEMLKIEKLESLGVLAGGIAHDFNNILTGIIGNTSMAKVHLEDGHASLQSITAAEKAAVRAGELAHQLLTFAKGGEPIKRIVSPHALIEDSLSIVLSGSSVKAVVNIPDTVHAFEADEGQMSQVFRNVLLNAVQAMPGGGTLTVAARNTTLSEGNRLSLPVGEYVRFTFEDEGFGIPQSIISKVFDPYFTTKPSGNGLGLASAFSIVTKHGGHIDISSAEAEGTLITVFLPSTAHVYSNEKDQDFPVEYGGQNDGAVLVMDDEAVVLEIAESILKHLGYSVTTCDEGEKAVELYRQAFKSKNPFFIVILDLTIPGGMGGKETAKKILTEFPEARLIVSSGYSNDPILSQYGDHGFIGAIKKPYSLNEFAASLRQIEIN